jgi:hypothetical protein
MRRAMVVVAAVVALGTSSVLLPAGPGFAGNPTTSAPATTEPPGTTTTSQPTPPSMPGVIGARAVVGPADPGTGGGCTPSPDTRVESNDLALCHVVTNIGDVDLPFVRADMTVTIDGEPVPFPDPTIAGTTLASGDVESVFQVATASALLPPCDADEQRVTVETERDVQVSVTWTFEPDVVAEASSAFTLVGETSQCVPVVGEPPTFTG